MSSDPLANLPPIRPNTLGRRQIDGPGLKSLIEAGLGWLRTNQQSVNALNVFPVPDGDTGTNMVLTMQAAFDEIADSPEHNFGKMAHSVAHGALMGARGNSGVILSQIWRGFARAVDSQETMDAASFVRALASARDTAYKGVVRPVEGTILTVAKDIATSAEKALNQTDDLVSILEQIVVAADESVQHTPELLATLREAGVVDAGGKGLFFILEGMLRQIRKLPLETPVATIQPLAAMNLENTLEVIEPGQDFEVVIDFRPNGQFNVESFYQTLDQIGTSIQVGEGDGIYRMHIHVSTEKLYDPIEYSRSLGTITKVAIENLAAQMEDVRNNTKPLILASVEPGQIAAIAVAPGPGIARVFASLGASAIVEGGQTMNPSTQEIIRAFENLPTDNIIILPNNKNIFLTAKATAELTVKNVAVIPSKSVPQGLAALLHLSPDGDLEEVAQEMTDALREAETGEITTATRSVEMDGVTVREGEFIALHNGKLVLASSDLEEACIGLLEKAGADQLELITLFYGSELPRSEVNRIADRIRTRFPEQEIEIQDGGQPHYHFIISME